LLLIRPLACSDDVEERKECRRETDRLELFRGADVRCAPEPEEKLASELCDRCFG
jgi:hypothetical protein